MITIYSIQMFIDIKILKYVFWSKAKLSEMMEGKQLKKDFIIYKTSSYISFKYFEKLFLITYIWKFRLSS